MLAVATGWTQRVISGETGEVSDDFRRASHWALYAGRVGPLLIDAETFAASPEPHGMKPNDRASFARARLDSRERAAFMRTALFPEDDDG